MRVRCSSRSRCWSARCRRTCSPRTATPASAPGLGSPPPISAAGGRGRAPASRARPWRPPRGPAGLSPPRRRRRGPSQSCSPTAVRRCSAAARRQRLRSVGARRERRVRDGLRKRRKLRGLAELGLPHALKADCTPQRGAQPSTSWRERAQPAASAQSPRHCHTPSRAGARRCVMDGACACACVCGRGGGAALTSSHSDSAVMDSVARSSALKASRCTDRLHAAQRHALTAPSLRRRAWCRSVPWRRAEALLRRAMTVLLRRAMTVPRCCA